MEWRLRAADRNSVADRGAFTIAEILVALAIIAILAAVLIPGLSPKIGSAQASNLIQDVRSISNGLQQFRENVGWYPSTIASLSTFSSGNDLCGASIPATNVNQWRGPYIAMTPLAAGIPSGDAMIGLALTRTPTTTSSSTVMAGTMSFDVTAVDSIVVSEVETAFDGSSASVTKYSTGSVLWAKASGLGVGTTGTLTYKIPVRGC